MAEVRLECSLTTDGGVGVEQHGDGWKHLSLNLDQLMTGTVEIQPTLDLANTLQAKWVRP